MGRHYLDPADEADPYKLPTLVVEHDLDARDEDGEPCPGWFYAIAGCLNDTDPCGPFDTEQAAVADAWVEAGAPEGAAYGLDGA